jgi:hypothetical protein
MSDSIKTPIGIVRILLVLIIIASIVLIDVVTLRFGSVMIVVLALVNFLERKDDENRSRFLLLMFIAMAICSIADFLMAGIFDIIPGESLINGVIFFLTGHVIYLLALRDLSPLLLRSESPKLVTRNLLIWFVGMMVLFVLFFFTLYNPTEMVFSIGLVFYGIFLTSSLVFSITKWFDDFPQRFSAFLIIGFLLFFISDYILGLDILKDIVISGVDAVGITYLSGQMMIHLSPLFSDGQ